MCSYDLTCCCLLSQLNVSTSFSLLEMSISSKQKQIVPTSGVLQVAAAHVDRYDDGKLALRSYPCEDKDCCFCYNVFCPLNPSPTSFETSEAISTNDTEAPKPSNLKSPTRAFEGRCIENDEQTASSYCVDCGHYLCRSCELIHKRFTALKHHRLEALEVPSYPNLADLFVGFDGNTATPSFYEQAHFYLSSFLTASELVRQFQQPQRR